MAKLPSFQFYPGDWLKDPELRLCSPAARGVFMDTLCIMFESQRRGILRTNGKPWTPEQLAKVVGCEVDSVHELLENSVIKRSERTGCMYSKRMVRDELVRLRRARGGNKGADYGALGGRPRNPSSNGRKTPSQTGRKPLGERVNNPPSSSSSSSPSGYSPLTPQGVVGLRLRDRRKLMAQREQAITLLRSMGQNPNGVPIEVLNAWADAGGYDGLPDQLKEAAIRDTIHRRCSD